MHTTDVLSALWSLLPRGAQRVVARLFVVAMITGLATPFAMWWVRTYEHELTVDWQPTLERLLTIPTPVVTP
jgi:hypothetical protein